MSDKKRYDYSKIGLVKKDGNVFFDGERILLGLKEGAQTVAAEYGIFVMATRVLAGHEKDTDAEKRELVKGVIDWLKADCPKRTKAGRVSIKQATIDMLKEQIKSASKAEGKILQSIVDKMELEIAQEAKTE